MTGEAGYHNLGDEAMALASAHRLKQYFPTADLVATGLDPLGAVLRHQARIVPWPLLPGDIQSSYPLRLIRKYAQKAGAGEDFLDPFLRPLKDVFRQQYQSNESLRSVVKEMEKADFVFDMGHGALNDVFSPFMICMLYYLAGELNKPLFISGQSIGPLWRRASLQMLRSTLPVAHTVGLRDSQVSKNILLEQVGVNDGQVHMVEIGDDTLDLVAKEPAWRSVAPQVVDLIQSGQFVAVQWRTSDYSQHLGDTESLVPLIRLVETIHQQTGLPIVFVPMSWETRHSDVLVAARIHDFLCQPAYFHVLWNYLEAPDTKWILGRARFGIGLSYHFHVFSLSQGVPTIPLFTNPYYEVKLKGAMAAFGHSIAPVKYPPTSDTSEQFRNGLEAILNWSDADRTRLLEHAEASRLAWHDAFRLFAYDCHLER